MSNVPSWLAQLRWSQAWSVAALNEARHRLPDGSGCYVFTADAGGLRPGAVLYIGKAKRLRQRVPGYLVDWRRTRPTQHKGRAFVFAQRHAQGDHATFVRWVQYGGNPAELETNLCEFYDPDFTDRWETQEFWNDEETIDPRLLG